MYSGDPDVVVIGGGPNGLVAAAVLAGAGLHVLLLEAASQIGGAVRSGEVTLPGFQHDLFSGFYPLARVGPLSGLPLERYGLEWCTFPRPYGGGTPGGVGFALEQTPSGTGRSLALRSPGDVAGWNELWGSWLRYGRPLLDLLFHPLGSLGPALHLGLRIGSPSKLWDFLRLALAPSRTLANQLFVSEDARVWLIGSALHSDLAPEAAGSGFYSLVLSGLAQQVGMPIPRGGAQTLSNALGACIEDRGGIVQTDAPARGLVVRGGRVAAVSTPSGEVRARRAVLATVEPQQLFLQLVGEGHLDSRFVHAVRRYEWGTGVFKLDCALDGLPEFAAEALNGVGVLHLGESSAELSVGTGQIAGGLLPAHPLLIAGIHTLADPTRAPAGKHTLWIETHVPSRIRGDAGDTIAARDWGSARAPFAERLLAELERHAPGVRRQVLGVHAQSPDDLYASNANLVGGDIVGGASGLHQQAVLRPVPGWFRHRTPIRGLYLGGASTHPGGGVHGASGANAARVLLGDLGVLRRRGGSGPSKARPRPAG